MRITNLKVTNGTTGEIIRDILFNIKGLNLIVDNDKGQKSNNTGKSTVTHSIDFCLGAKKEIFFKGAGKSHSDSIIEEFLYREHITFELKLKDENGKTYIIERGFKKSLTKKGKEKRTTVWFLDGKEIEKGTDSGNKELKPIFFGDDIPTPTFRQLIGKFLRDNPFSLGDAVVFYHPNTTNKRAVLDRLFYNKIDSIAKETELTSDIKNQTGICARYKNKYGSIKELEEYISHQKNSLQTSKKEFKQKLEDTLPSSLIPEYQEVRQHYRLLIDNIVSIKLDINNIENSIYRYQNDQSDIDISAVQTLYNEMQLYNDILSKTFEETIIFHTSMLKNRIAYLENILKEKKILLKEQEEKQQILVEKYDHFVIDIDKTRLEDIEGFTRDNFKIIGDIEYNERIAKEWTETKKQLEENQKNFKEISTTSNATDITIQVFNEIFTQYTREIYNEEMFLSIPEEYVPYILKNVTNSGEGKEKAIITIFDLAYLKCMEKLNKTSPRFTAIDVFEPTDEPTIVKIFEIANSLDSQLIIPVLRSKISFIKGIEQYFIVELNNDNKFFKLP